MSLKTKKAGEHKRHGRHHSHNHQYKQIYWPYLPLVGLAIVMLAFSILPQRGTSKTLAYATEMSRETLLQATNSRRSANDRERLTLQEALNNAAQAKADDMAKRDYWSHKTPEGQDPWVFIDQTGYKYQKAGENLAYGFIDSNTTVNGWMNSQTHRDNLLDTAFTQVGFGFANANNYQKAGPETIVVALYGRPQALGSSVPVGNTQQTIDEKPVIAEAPKAVTKVESISDGKLSWAPFAVGLISGGAAVGLLVNHGLRLRRLIRKGERYFVAHPILDIALLIIAFACVELSRTVGYIH